jgi:hypothetical protein
LEWQVERLHDEVEKEVNSRRESVVAIYIDYALMWKEERGIILREKEIWEREWGIYKKTMGNRWCN